MKLSEVKTDMLREALLAVQDLRRKYKEEPQKTKYAGSNDVSALAPQRCPLCNFYRLSRDSDDDVMEGYLADDDCFCPWFWIEGHGCEDWEEEGDFGMELMSYDDFTIPLRLERVNRWEMEIKDELARRGA